MLNKFSSLVLADLQHLLVFQTQWLTHWKRQTSTFSYLPLPFPIFPYLPLPSPTFPYLLLTSPNFSYLFTFSYSYILSKALHEKNEKKSQMQKCFANASEHLKMIEMMIFMENDEKLGNGATILMMRVTDIYKHEKMILMLNFNVMVFHKLQNGLILLQNLQEL